MVETAKEVEIARAETTEIIADVFQIRKANKVSDMIGRWRRLDSKQIEQIRQWLLDVKENARLNTNERYS